jgi:hypothetical protein
MNRIGTDKSTNYVMPFLNKRRVEQNGIEEIIEINPDKEQNCDAVVFDCKKSLISLGYEEVNDDSANGITENVKGSTDEEQIKDCCKNVSIDEDLVKYTINDFLQKDRFIDYTEELMRDDGSIKEEIYEVQNLTKVTENNTDNVTLMPEKLSGEENVYNSLNKETDYLSKVNAIDMLSRLVDISQKLK